MHTFGSIAFMSAIRGRGRRPDRQPYVLLQARIPPELREDIQAAAEASGASIAFYVESLLKSVRDEHGGLPVLDVGRPQQEELPIPAA